MRNLSLDDDADRREDSEFSSERLPRRVAELLAAEPELQGTMALASVVNAMTQPQMSIRRIVATAMEG